MKNIALIILNVRSNFFSKVFGILLTFETISVIIFIPNPKMKFLKKAALKIHLRIEIREYFSRL
jgi:hypothetical protein